MINTYRYGGHKNLREDNTTQKLEVRPSKILVKIGDRPGKRQRQLNFPIGDY
jgi:hypothetical protein